MVLFLLVYVIINLLGDIMNNEIKYYTITALNRAIKNMFDEKEVLHHIYLKGEISNFKHHTRGHLYFTLKDENSRIAAVMFSAAASKLTFEPEDGMKVLVCGRVTVYEANGGYQIYIEEMMLDGIGNLYLEFEKLKKKLEEEGLFKLEHKRKIPKFPKRIGIITAPTGAAIRDILSTIKRRFPICETILFPALVQGVGAKESIVREIEIAQDWDLDVIICGRGGGSIEDLWAFNEEIVARAIYNSKIPIISAVGHEIDFTIADFVADLRAPTPTGAAEMAVPNIADLNNLLDQYKIRSSEAINNKLKISTRRLDELKNNYILRNPLSLYEIKEQRLDNIIDILNKYIVNRISEYKIRLNNIKSSYILKNPLSLYENKEHIIEKNKEILNKLIINYLDNNKHRYSLLASKLELLNPLKILSNGYSVLVKDNKIIRDSKDLKIGDMVDIRLFKGNIKTEVKEIKNGN